MAKRGIDISAHQGFIDLAALKDQIDFVIIRVGYGVAGTIDNKFKRNTDLCEQLGIPYGFYWYSYALNVSGAESEAKAFLNAIEPYNPSFGCWFDMEDADGYKKRNGMPPNQTLQDMCYKFCEIVEDVGYYAGIYASQSWFNNQLNSSNLSRFDKWVAQWPTSGGKQTALATSPDKKSGLNLWQFTSEGVFDGYTGRLDVNYAYVDHLLNLNGKNAELIGESKPEPSPEPTPEPEQPKKSNEEIAQEVIDGKWGNGDERKNRLKEAGYDYKAIQAIVNKLSKKPASTTEDAIVKGSRVKFTGTKSYSGIALASWTKGYVFNVIEVSGDRVVIGKGTVVTAAVNMKDCKKI